VSYIEFQNVSRIYQNRWYALQNVSFSIGKGEFVFIIGPTGAGKTTLLSHIYFKEFPTSGRVSVLGYSSDTISRDEIPFLRRKIGVIFQDFKLLFDRNVLKNVSIALEVTGESPRNARRKAIEVLDKLGMADKAEKMPNELSGGEGQKVAIARALVREPYILLADEPTGNIDPESSEEIFKILKRVNDRGTTVIVATHNYNFLEKVVRKRVISLKAGKIESDEKFYIK